MKPLEKIKEKIRKHIEKHEGGKPYRLSVDSGLHRNTLNGWNKPEWNPEYSTLAAVDAQIDVEMRLKKTLKKKGLKNA